MKLISLPNHWSIRRKTLRKKKLLPSPDPQPAQSISSVSSPSAGSDHKSINKPKPSKRNAFTRSLPFVSTKRKTLPKPDSFAYLRPHLSYLPAKEIRQIKKAFVFAQRVHQGQTRRDGSPYISHPIAACKILAQIHLDSATLVAALLHDVIEDCHVCQAEIMERFGEKVARVVEGVTKLGKLDKRDIATQQAQNFQKMLLAMASDLRVILVKLADRLHNMRTLASMNSESRKRIAHETMDIYAPIANRIGLDAIFHELQDLAFQYLYPMRMRTLQAAINNEHIKREDNLQRLRQDITKKLKTFGIKAQVSTRMKNTYSIYCKMKARRTTFDKIYDVCGLRIIIEKQEQCYYTLGILHSLYKPIPGRFKDFIALPKSNGYQSLHTTIVAHNGIPVEVQIRSNLMHLVAESGLAAHWFYKDKIQKLSDLELRANQWISSLIELNKTSANAGELLENVKIDLFNDSVYIFTPQGKIVTLPRGATALDFAYSIHTDIGHHAHLATINNEERSLRTELKTGDCVNISTRSTATVTVASMTYTKTARARSQIRHYLRHLDQQHLQQLGEHWLRQILFDIAPSEKNDLSTLPLPDIEKRLVAVGLCTTGQIERLLSEIALGAMSPVAIAQTMLKKELPPYCELNHLLIHSAQMPMVHFATCCFPIHLDHIAGIMKNSEGLTIHRYNCKQVLSLRRKTISMVKENQQKIVLLAWSEKVEGQFLSRITVLAHNVSGVFATISSIIAEHGCNIVGIQMHTTYEKITPIGIDLLVDNRIVLGQLFKHLHRLATVKSVIRWRQDMSS